LADSAGSYSELVGDDLLDGHTQGV
jgi:hypothetical protein